jgi:hypothetical protein
MHDLARAACARRRSPGNANAVSPSPFRPGSIRASLADGALFDAGRERIPIDAYLPDKAP